MKNKLVYASGALICLALCVVIAKFLGGYPFVRGFVGDAIVVCLIYFAVKAVADVGAGRLAWAVMFFAYGVEALQYLDLLGLTGLQGNALARVVLGSVFDPLDLAAYSLGAIVAYWCDKFIALHIAPIVPTH
ncbi:MAG TPA: DUF2809 domain-containing protein [Gallionella sp.]|nr:DUF2809 domain-containing protein [Gallionella sp.]